MQEALQNDLNQEVIMLWHKDKDISMFNQDDCIVLPGGFSFGDYLRCGAIAKFSPMMQSVISFANNGGKVLGVCNGFQILCEAHLLPGVLLRNVNQQFLCKNVYLKGVGSDKGKRNHHHIYKCRLIQQCNYSHHYADVKYCSQWLVGII